MIMAFDPDDPLQRRALRRLRGHAAGGLAAQPELPGRALQPAQRPHALLRLPVRARSARRRPSSRWPRATARARTSSSRATTRTGSTSSSSSCCSAACRPPARRRPRRRTPGGRSSARRPSSTSRRYYPVRIVELRAGAGHRRRGAAPRRHGHREDVRLPRAGRGHDQRRPRRDPARGASAAAATAACSAKMLIRADGERVPLPSKIDYVKVQPGDRLVFRTAGAGGWGDPFERDRRLVRRDVRPRPRLAEGALALRRRVRRDGVVDEARPPSGSASARARRAGGVRLRGPSGPAGAVQPVGGGLEWGRGVHDAGLRVHRTRGSSALDHKAAIARTTQVHSDLTGAPARYVPLFVRRGSPRLDVHRGRGGTDLASHDGTHPLGTVRGARGRFDP